MGSALYGQHERDEDGDDAPEDSAEPRIGDMRHGGFECEDMGGGNEDEVQISGDHEHPFGIATAHNASCVSKTLDVRMLHFEFPD